MPSLQSKDILIIDDAPDIILLVKKILEADGARVLQAETVDEALEISVQKIPHLIITDLDLPVKTGFDLLKHRRENKSLKDIPVIVLSGRNDKASVLEALSLGADDYLLKPFRATLLLQKVWRAFRAASFRVYRPPAGAEPTATVSLAAEVRRASEGGLQLETSVKLAAEQKISLTGDFITRIGCGEVLMRTSRKPGLYAEKGRYLNDVNLIGVGEAFARLIRNRLGNMG
jgi:DNA-binding response OmpR family regulator